MPGGVSDQQAARAIRDRLRGGQPTWVRLWGRSMMPAVTPGTRVLFEPTGASRLRRGDVLLVERADRLFAHRLVARQGGALRLAGDHALEGDPPVAVDAVLGRAVSLTLGPVSPQVPAPLGRSVNRTLGLASRQVGRRLRLWRGPLPRLARPARALRRRLTPVEVGPASDRPTWIEACRRRGRWSDPASVAADLGASPRPILATHRGRPVGWARPDADGAVDLWVDPRFRGLGVASALLAAVVEEGRAAGLPALTLVTPWPAGRWMLTRGWVLEATRPRPDHRALRHVLPS